MTLTSTIQSRIDSNLIVSGALQTTTALLNYAKTLSIADGTGSGQADQVYTDAGTLAASGTAVIDLAAPLTNPAGQDIKFTDLKVLMFFSDSANQDTISIGPNGALNPLNAWFSSSAQNIRLNPGSSALLTSSPTGWAVTENSADKFLITNDDASNTADYELVIIGVATVV